ncbi:MAG: AmmeMemoRadiSam system radical SAM enzyme [Candidatus Schekmanbacteria bacterium]|nr:AmmeMemoRadiSam system radical SAM enzyme [Candidatus Schekmanbacteria bacterium]
MYEALYYEVLTDQRVHCLLCPHGCLIKEGKRGICWGRHNIGGKLYSEFYAQTISIANDPIEKKPLYHFYPGTYILSIGANGCNLRCQFCQNWEISQERSPTTELTPKEAVETALRYKSIGIAYTYTEPFMWYEYVLDTAQLARSAGLKNVMVTNGYVNEAPLRQLLPYVDAMNIDLKSFRNDFYHKICGGKLEPVLEAIKIAQAACQVELTTLLVTDTNDTMDEINDLTDWIVKLNPEIPLHFSRYFPRYKMTNPPTPLATLQRAGNIAQNKLKYVYLGNVADKESNCTYCPKCKIRLIEREGYYVQKQLVKNSKCPVCKAYVPVIGS